jgi:hypothetical protein
MPLPPLSKTALLSGANVYIAPNRLPAISLPVVRSKSLRSVRVPSCAVSYRPLGLKTKDG